MSRQGTTKRASLTPQQVQLSQLQLQSPEAAGQSFVIGAPNQEALSQNLRTRRTKAMINFTLEDFSRIHSQFADKNRPAYIETPVYSFHENEKIKFQLRLLPSKHSMNVDALYKGTEQSAQLFLDVFLLDNYGRRYNFEYGRKVECQLSSVNSENSGNFVYDRDDLEKKREKLFIGDKLVLGLEVNATWVDISDTAQNITE